MTFLYNGTTTNLGTGTLSTTEGVTTATFKTAALVLGADTITASYAGDTKFLGQYQQHDADRTTGCYDSRSPPRRAVGLASW